MTQKPDPPPQPQEDEKVLSDSEDDDDVVEVAPVAKKPKVTQRSAAPDES